MGSSSYFGGCQIFNTERMVMTEVPCPGRDVSWELGLGGMDFWEFKIKSYLANG